MSNSALSNLRQYFSKSSKSQKKGKPFSLRNIGATCYLNSALQGLSSCDKFVKEINSLYDNIDDKKLYNKLSLFRDLISLLNGEQSGVLEISRNPIFQSWKKNGQQDSFELISYVLNQVYNELRKNKENSDDIPKKDMQSWLQVHLPMRIVIQYYIKCECGNLVHVPLQADLALHVTIPSREKMDLQKMVDKFFEDDKIEEYECDKKCKQSPLGYRLTRLCLPLPNTICVHLQRSHWDGHFMTKIDRKINFGETLTIKCQFFVSKKQTEHEVSKNELLSDNDKIMDKDEQTNVAVMHKYISERNNSSDNTMDNNKSRKDSNSQNVQMVEPLENSLNRSENGSNFIANNEVDEVYYLTSVIVHYGSVNCGHYVCYKCVNNQWFLTNDSLVYEVKKDDVFNSKAYILFYEKP